MVTNCWSNRTCKVWIFVQIVAMTYSYFTSLGTLNFSPKMLSRQSLRINRTRPKISAFGYELDT